MSWDLVIALAAAAFAVGARLLLDAFVVGTVPFAASFPAVTVAALIGGRRAGLLSVALCSILVWYFILPPARSFHLGATAAVSLVIAIFSQLLVVVVASGYRKAAVGARQEKERELELKSLMLREIDHRTKNNFMIAGALLNAQASAAKQDVAHELRQASTRLMAIAGTYGDLAESSSGLSRVRLHDHLADLCTRLREGMLPAGISLAWRLDELEVDAQMAVHVSLIVNEWVTNAIKYAFPDGIGTLNVTLERTDSGFRVSVADDGIGAPPAPRKGSGLRLAEVLARNLGSHMQRMDGPGTCWMLEVALA